MLKFRFSVFVSIFGLIAVSCGRMSVRPALTLILTENPPIVWMAVVQSVTIQIMENSPFQFDLFWSEGQSMDMDQAIEFALKDDP